MQKNWQMLVLKDFPLLHHLFGNTTGNWYLFLQEISILKKIFHQNGYPYIIILLSINLSAINLFQKRKIKAAKMATIDA